MTTIRVFLLLFLSGYGLSSWGQATESDSEDIYGPPVLEEIIVTAQKIGEQNLLDVPLSVTAIGEDELARRNIKGMDDYLRFQPGTNFVDRGVSRNSAIIRGITADPGRGGAIAGVYIDETPVQGLGFAGGSPDLKLVDVERVEVLRGPQGTLYGGGSMSGTVRTLTRAPDTSAFEGWVRLGGSETAGFGGFNSEAEAMINLPLADERFALRGVVYRFDNSGYIRNVGTTDPIKVNSASVFETRLNDRVNDRGNDTYKGYRIGALWHATDRLDIRLTAMGQKIEQDGFPTTDWRQAPFEQSRFARLDGRDENLFDDFKLYSILVDYAAENWSLLSSTSWTDYDYGFNWDVGLFFLDALDGLEPPYWLYQGGPADVFTQELRWNWDAGGRWRILVGAFYQDQNLGFDQNLNWESSPELDPFDGFFVHIDRGDDDIEQTSVFADANYQLSDQWELTAGVRRYQFDVSNRWRSGGNDDTVKSSETGNSWKAGVNWYTETLALGEAPLIYATWSQGFRPGRPVGPAPSNCDLDGDGIIDENGLQWRDIESDELDSLELGYKTEFAQRRVSAQTAVFDISWDGIPIDIAVGGSCASTLPFNAGSARSRGFEFALSALLTDSLQLDLTASWVNAELTEDAPGVGMDGDRLPGSPEYNTALGLEYDFQWGGFPGWARSDLSWVGGYYSTLQKDPPKLGDYLTVDLATGMAFDHWSVDLYVQNLTDEAALTWANPIWAPYPRGSVLRPRTFGARVGYRFGAD